MKLLKVIKWALLALSVIVFIYAILTVTGVDSASLNLYMGWTYALVATALVATVGFPLIGAMTNKKSFLKLILLIVIYAVVICGAFALAGGDFADTVLYVTYLFVAVAVLSLAWMGILSLIRK